MAAGKKTGGRRAGTPNKASAAKAAAVEASGLSPLDFMLSLVRDATVDRHARLDAAKSAAPYVHPRISPTDGNRDGEETIPLAERLKSYVRKDAIASSAGKVVDIAKAAARR